MKSGPLIAPKIWPVHPPLPKVICFYSVSTHLGGAERSLLDLVLGLLKHHRDNYHPVVLLPKESGPLVDCLAANQIPFNIIPFPDRILKWTRKKPHLALIQFIPALFSLADYLKKLRNWAISNHVQLIHSSGIKCHFFSAIIGIFLRIPILWHLRDIMDVRTVNTLLGGLLFLNKNIAIVSNSQATAQSFPYGRNKHSVIHNGIDLPNFHWGESQQRSSIGFRQKYQFPSHITVIGIVGALAKWKGQMLFIEMAKSILAAGFEAKFMIVGGEIYDTEAETGYLEVLGEKVKSLGLEKDIYFTGFIKDLQWVYSSLDILVHASLKPEPFGRVIIEGMASGVPVIASAAGGVLEIIRDGENGLLFDPGNLESLTGKVIKLLTLRGLRQKLIVRGKETVSQNFTLGKSIEKVVKKYEKMFLNEGPIQK